MKHSKNMQKRSVLFSALCTGFAALIFACVLFSVSVRAAEEVTDAVIDDFSASPWHTDVPLSHVVKVDYTAENARLSTGANDTGYQTAVYTNADTKGTFGISRDFAQGLNLFDYKSMSFFIRVAAPDVKFPPSGQKGVERAVYTVTTVVSSFDRTKTYVNTVKTNLWQNISLDVGAWPWRNEITEISVSVGVEAKYEDSFTLSFSIDSLTAQGAADTSYEQHFMSDALTPSGASALLSGDGAALELTHTGTEAISVTGQAVFSRPDQISAYDGLRVFAANHSDDRVLTLSYTYKDADRDGGSDVVFITPSAVPHAYYFHVPELYRMDTFTLTWGDGRTARAAGGADAVLYRIEPVRLCEEVPYSPGSVKRCVLSGDASAVMLEGTVAASEAVRYLKYRIAVYAIPAVGDVSYHIETSDPVATADMTTQFSMRIPVQKLPAEYLIMRYAVVITDDEGGEYILIGTPQYITNASVKGKELPAIYSTRGFKGLVSEEAHEAGNARTTVINVYCDKLTSAAYGRMYVYGGKLYYFESEYTAALDEQIKGYSQRGCSVILRLLISDTARFVPVQENNPDSSALLCATVSFLTERYSSAERGYITGMIAGLSLCDDTVPLSPLQYARRMAQVLRMIHQTGTSHISDFKVYAAFDEVTEYASVPGDGGMYDSMLLLRHLSDVISRGGQFEWYVFMCGKRTDSFVYQDENGVMAARVFVDEAPYIEQAISAAGRRGDAVPGGILFMWEPEGEMNAHELAAKYLSAYYRLLSGNLATGFLLAPDRCGIADKESFYSSFFRYVDTDASEQSEEFVLSHLPGFTFDQNEKEVARARAWTLTVTPAGEAPVTGQCVLWDFAGAYDAGGWTHVRSSFGMGGAAAASEEGGAGCGVLYSAVTAPIDFTLTPIFEFTVYVSSAQDEALPIRIEFVADGERRVVTGVVNTNRETRITADLSGFEGLAGVSYMEIYTTSNTVSQFYVTKIMGGSLEYNSEELAQMLKSQRTAADVHDEHQITLILSLSAVMIALSVGAAVILGKNH